MWTRDEREAGSRKTIEAPLSELRQANSLITKTRIFYKGSQCNNIKIAIFHREQQSRYLDKKKIEEVTRSVDSRRIKDNQIIF